MYNFYTANKHLSRKEIFDRFTAIGAPERSLNRWLCNLEQNKTLKRKKGSGRIAKKATPKVIKAIKRKFNHRTGCSQINIEIKILLQMMNHTSLFRIQLNQGMTFFTQTTFRRRLKV